MKSFKNIFAHWFTLC